MARKFTLILTGLSNLEINRIERVIPKADGFTQLQQRSTNQVAISANGTTQTLNLAIDAVMTQADLALFDEYLFEQERNGKRGLIQLRNEYTPINTRWSTINSRTQFGSAQTTHGAITQYFVQYPILLIVPSDYWEVAGEDSSGQWRNVQFEAEEII